MSIFDTFKKKEEAASSVDGDSKKTSVHEEVTVVGKPESVTVSTHVDVVAVEPLKAAEEEENLGKITPKNIGKLDMVIAFDTTGSMAMYIDAVRKQVSELIPNLFKDNDDLRIGIVAFGDYCDMKDATTFGDAYQCIPPTNNENDLIKFVLESKNTSGGDGPEFYELVLKKIIEETEWREGSTRSILLISDAEPHELGYTFKDYVVGNQIDWREEARKAAEMKIKVDTVTIRGLPWYKELSAMTNGVSVPFRSGEKTADLVYASVNARGSEKARLRFDEMLACCDDVEMKEVMESYLKERNEPY
ncbi:MAG: VWA domain-containing protein [Muribaculaceae bacterium]|nr:VWA domain-containing protein [Muribaculaceae bacterium]